MRRLRALALLAVLPLLAAGGGQRDVNRDGRIDLGDVKALARMVAGLDPQDLAFDQNGDRALTVEDVSLLSAAVDLTAPTDTGAAPEAVATPPPQRPASAGESEQYLVVQQAADGRVVVVVGTQGVRAGDRILGLYPTLEEAAAERTRLARDLPRAGSGGARPTPVPQRAPPQPPAAPLPTIEAPSTRAAEAALPIPELAGTSELIPLGPGRALAASADWRKAWLIEAPLDQDATATLRARPLSVFAGLDPTLSHPCAYFDSGGRVDALFTFLPGTGDARLVQGLASGGRLRPVRVTMVPTLQGKGGLLVLPRRGDNGETVGIYLYHWPSGTALYAPRLASGARRLRATRLSGYPRTRVEPIVLPALGRSAETRSFTVLEPSAAAVWTILDVRYHPTRPSTVSTAVDLSTLTPPDIAGQLALAAAPLLGADHASSAALLVEGRSGRLGVLDGHDNPATIRLRVLEGTLDGVFPPADGSRRLFVLTLARPGHALVLEGQSGRLAEVALGAGNTVSVRPVTVGR